MYTSRQVSLPLRSAMFQGVRAWLGSGSPLVSECSCMTGEKAAWAALRQYSSVVGTSPLKPAMSQATKGMPDMDALWAAMMADLKACSSESWSPIQHSGCVCIELPPARLKVTRWLPYTDTDAAAALRTPVFRLKLVIDPSQAEINFDEEDGKAIDTAGTQEKIEKVLEIAPAGEPGHSLFYFGKMSDYPYFFLLDMHEVRILGASVFVQD